MSITMYCVAALLILGVQPLCSSTAKYKCEAIFNRGCFRVQQIEDLQQDEVKYRHQLMKIKERATEEAAATSKVGQSCNSETAL